MRRRRNAAASSDSVESVDSTPSAADSLDIEAVPTETAAAASEATPSASTADAPPVTGDAATDEAGAAPKTPRRRAPARRRTPAAAAAEDTTVAETGVGVPEPAPAAEAAATPAPESDSAPSEEPAAEPKPRRRTVSRRRKDEPTAETPAAPAEEPATVQAASPEPTEAAETPAPTAAETSEAEAGESRSSRRRSRNRGRGATGAEVVPAPEVMAEIVPPSASPADDTAASVSPGVTDTAGAASEAPAAGVKSARTRGVRTRRTPAAPPQQVASPVIEAVGETVEAAEGEAAQTAKPKRVRGLRKPAPASVAATATAAEGQPAAPTLTTTPSAPAEPLPPVYKPLPVEVLERLPETKIVVTGGVPDLVVNGEPRLPVWFFVNTEDAAGDLDETEDPEAAFEAARDTARREIRYAYEAGVRTFTVLAHLPWRTRSGERRYDVLDDILQFVADNAPEAFVLPRLIFSPTLSWERTHPDQMSAYADGETGDVSIASRAFWEGEAEEALRAAVEHVAQGPHAGRVFGFYLEHGEWLYEKGRGYDISEANQQGFRAWLRTRYKNNVVALRAAWGDGEVTFDTATIPVQPVPAGPTLFFTPREQRYADFHEYASDAVTSVITRLGKAIKETSGGRSAVAVSYGYTLELARAASGHLALGPLLSSPYVDILTGPVSYSGRTPGGSAPFPAPVDSVRLAGKLWVSEDDTKTFLARGTDTPDAYNPKVPSYEGTWAAYARNFGAALASGAGVSWMDLWGRGWLDDRELWERLGRLRAFAQNRADARRAAVAANNDATAGLAAPDVAVIVDERSFFDVRSSVTNGSGREGADEVVLGGLIAHQRDALLRSGARVGFYLLSDLLKPDFPIEPKLLLFLNAFRLPENVRAAIQERFQNDGRTLAWVYAPGAREANPAELADTLGIQLRLQPWGAKMGTQVLSNVRSPLTDNLRGQRLGEETRVNPSYYVSDSRAQVLGEYAATGNPSIAVRKHARWQSVFIGEMSLPLPLLRGLYHLAGVPVFTVDDDVAWFGDRLITLHSAPGGGTTVYLPSEGALYDVLADETLAASGWGARLSMPPRGTRLLVYGTPEEITALGGDPAGAPHGLTESELPPPPAAFAFEAGSEPAPMARPFASRTAHAASAEDAALMEAALAGEYPPAVEDEPDAATAGATAPGSEVEAGADSKKKRRRRRRRRPGDAEDVTASDTAEAGDDAGASDEGVDEAEDAAFVSGDTDTAEAGTDPDASPLLPGFQVDLPSESPEELASEPLPPSPPDFAAAPGPRPRPSLEELLPNSDFPDGADLPPIPDEFLPLDTSSLSAPVAVSGEGETDDSAAAPTRRPRRRPVSRRRTEETPPPESGDVPAI